MTLSLIVAMAKNRVIGKDNKLPWHLSEDLKRFKKLTTGHPIIMGRKTFQSIGRPLPKRENIVLSRHGFSAEGIQVYPSLKEALKNLNPSETEAFIIGGAEIYRQALPHADRIYLTVIEKDFEGDAFFPELPKGEFEETSREDHEDSPPYSFRVLERLSPSITR